MLLEQSTNTYVRAPLDLFVASLRFGKEKEGKNGVEGEEGVSTAVISDQLLPLTY